MQFTFSSRTRQALACCAATLAAFHWGLPTVVADPSLDPDDYFEVKTDIFERKDEPISLLRDHEDPRRFYYIPSMPRVSRINDQRGNVPEFTLLRYQFQQGGKPNEGGVLQFTVELSLPDESKEILLQNLAGVLSKGGERVDWRQLDLAPIPLKSSKVHFYSPDNGSFVASGKRTDSLAPTYVTQKMPYSLTLTREGTAVFDELITGPTGLACVYEIELTGMSPEAGFYVEVDWQKVLDMVSSDVNISSQVNMNYVFATSTEERNKNIQNMTNSLTSSGAVTAKAYGDDSIISTEELVKYMDGVLQRIYAEVYGEDQSIVPEKIDPATAEPADAGAADATTSLVVNTANLVAKISQNRKERFEFNVRETQSVKTAFGSFVGIGSWLAEKQWLDRESRSGLTPEGDAALREWGLLAYASDRGFENAYFSLPPVYPDQEWGLSQVRLEIQLLNERGAPITINSQTTHSADWFADGRGKTTGAWVDTTKKPMNCFLFPLGKFGFGPNGLEGLRFRNTVKLTMFSGKEMSYTRPIDCESGDLDLGNPFEPIEVLSIEPRGLKFESSSERIRRRLGGELIQAEVFLREPHSNRSKRVVLKKGEDRPFAFLLSPDPENDNNIRCGYTITYLIENDDFEEVACKPLSRYIDKHEVEASDGVFRPVIDLSMKQVLAQIAAAAEDSEQ